MSQPEEENPKKPEGQDQDFTGIEPVQTADLKDINPKSLENYILEMFSDDAVRERIRKHLKNIIGNELNKMSGVMRGAIKDWAVKERKKHLDEIESLKAELSQQKSLEFDQKAEELEEKNKQLERKLQLKEHENQIMFDSLKQFMQSKKES